MRHDESTYVIESQKNMNKNQYQTEQLKAESERASVSTTV